MSVEEKKLHVLIVDEGARVIVLINKEMAHELRGAKLHAAKVLFDLSTKPKPLSRPYDNTKRSKPYPAPPTYEINPTSGEVREALTSQDVIEPAPERHPVMPEGITRNRLPGSGSRYDEPAGRKVLRIIAEMNQPVQYRDVVAWVAEHTPDGERLLKEGTISSQLSTLSEKGYLWKQRNATKHALIYTLTDKGEDELTRPEQQPALDLRPMEGSA